MEVKSSQGRTPAFSARIRFLRRPRTAKLPRKMTSVPAGDTPRRGLPVFSRSKNAADYPRRTHGKRLRLERRPRRSDEAATWLFHGYWNRAMVRRRPGRNKPLAARSAEGPRPRVIDTSDHA